MKKLILTFLLITTLFFSVGVNKLAYAGSPIAIEPFNTLGTIVANDVHKWALHTLVWGIITNLVQLLTGTDVSGQIGDLPGQNTFAFLQDGINLALKMPPVGTKDYFTRTYANNILAPKQVYAAQTGTDFLRGTADVFFNIWRTLRNTAFAFFILIIVAVGLMVMMQYQTDPRTTVEAVGFIPKIATSLLLITFSWVVAGLILDLARVLQILVLNIFSGALGGSSPDLTTAFGIAIGEIVLLTSTVGVLLSPATAGLSVFIPLVTTLVILVILAVAFFMLLFELSKRYMYLIALAMLGPLAFLWGTLPGQQDTIATWFKTMLVSALTFPAVALLLRLAALFVPTRVVNNVTVPGEFGIVSAVGFLPILGVVMAIVTVMMATKVPAVIEDLIDVKAPGAGAKGGLQPGKILSGLPMVGKMFK